MLINLKKLRWCVHECNFINLSSRVDSMLVHKLTVWYYACLVLIVGKSLIYEVSDIILLNINELADLIHFSKGWIWLLPTSWNVFWSWMLQESQKLTWSSKMSWRTTKDSLIFNKLIKLWRRFWFSFTLNVSPLPSLFSKLNKFNI